MLRIGFRLTIVATESELYRLTCDRCDGQLSSRNAVSGSSALKKLQTDSDLDLQRSSLTHRQISLYLWLMMGLGSRGIRNI